MQKLKKFFFKQNQNKFCYVTKDYLRMNQKFTPFVDGKRYFPIECQFDWETTESYLSNKISITSVQSISNIISISVFIKCGSQFEKKSHSGTAHFLEHMSFKGTQKRTREELELEIENKGGNLNAYTTREYTSYILQVDKSEFNWGIELLSDILLSSIYSQHHINMEKRTIYTELLECLRETDSTLLEFAHENIYWEHSIGNPILGKKENINSVTREMIVDFHDLNYTGENFLFVVSGNISHEQIEEQTQKYFGNLVTSKQTKDNEILKNRSETPTFHWAPMIIESPLNELMFGMYWPACNWYGESYMAYLLLQRILGDFQRPEFLTSFKEIARGNSLIDQVQTKTHIKKLESVFLPYRKTGLFGFAFQVENGRQKETHDFAQEFINSYADNIKQEDLDKSKWKIIIELQWIENGVDLTQDIGSYKIYLNRVVPKTEFIQRVNKTELKEIQGILKNNLKNQEHSLCVMGDLKEAEKLAKLHKNFHMTKIQKVE